VQSHEAGSKVGVPISASYRLGAFSFVSRGYLHIDASGNGHCK
jgi:hypothetical protein